MYISDFSAPSAPVEYRWEQENPLALLFASFNLSKCIFSGFVEYLCNTAIFTRFALKYLKPEDIEKQTDWPI